MRASVVVALILAGCGGGSDETSVSANPPVAPSPATPSPAVPGPALIPPPKAPDAPAPVPPPGTLPVAPTPKPSIDASVLNIALGLQLQPIIPAEPQGFEGKPAFVGQDFHRDQFDPGTYRFWSAATTWTPDLVGSRTELRRTILTINQELHGTGEWLGEFMEADGTMLIKRHGFYIDGTIELDRSLAEWQGNGYSATLIVQSDDEPNWRLCWNLKLPSITRLSCGIFDRTTAAFRGAHIVDDSFGQGPLTWR